MTGLRRKKGEGVISRWWQHEAIRTCHWKGGLFGARNFTFPRVLIDFEELAGNIFTVPARETSEDLEYAEKDFFLSCLKKIIHKKKSF